VPSLVMYPPSYKKGNWGRWGKDDEVGTLNLVTPEVIKKAARLVKRGRVYSLGLPIRHAATGGPTFPGRVAPVHVALYSKRGPRGHGGGDDYLVLNTHNAPSHMDALGHFWMANRLYNNHSDDVVTSAGAEKCGIDKIGAIVTRGVLLDMARYQGVHHLKPGEVINAEDMVGCAKSEGVKFEVGDAVLVRSNFLSQFDPKNPQEYFEGNPGIGLSTVDLLDRNGTVAIGADTMYVEVHPSEVKDRVVPVHEELLWRRGMHFLEQIDLEGLAADRMYEFLFVVNPLKIERGLGSPINPVAIA
jgi:kynurenine formamidase